MTARLPAFGKAGQREAVNRLRLPSPGSPGGSQAQSAPATPKQIPGLSSRSPLEVDVPGLHALTELKEEFVTIHTIHRIWE